MARNVEEAAKTLVHYIKLALGDQVQGDMHAELQSVIDDFAAVDRELSELRQTAAPLRQYGARLR